MKVFDKRKVPGLEDCSSDSEDEDEIPAKRLCNNDDFEIELEVQDNEFLKEEPLINIDDKPKKFNNVWGDVVQENMLDESFNKIGVIQCNVQRNIESYVVEKHDNHTKSRKRKSNGHKKDESKIMDMEDYSKTVHKKHRLKRKNIKDRIGKIDKNERYENGDIKEELSYSDMNIECEKKEMNGNIESIPKEKSKERSHIPINPEVDSTQHIVFEIARLLQEPKIELIETCMNVLGKERCLEFFYMTEDIEENGGLMVVNGSRRRTAGGVFLTLIKESKKVDDACKRIIFPNDFAYRDRYRRQRPPFGYHGPMVPRARVHMYCNNIVITRAPEAPVVPLMTINVTADPINVTADPINVTADPINVTADSINVTADACKLDNEDELEEGEII